MSAQYVAKANVVKVSVGPATGNRVARFVRAGGLIPEGAEETSLKALEARGLITRLPDPVDLQEEAKALEELEALAAAADAKAAAEKEAADKAVAKAAADAAKKEATPKAATR